ncbi:GGDEF domain-containing protein [Amycolatopsis decaplanina]|uniref:GGDEF domain-containing diguanylate cyclase n=1 Tax=Amycolatopsis decaplanina DSM 44594 TaxID=1284240 RepID=M2XM82_9PSEU|nr:GGDEF domain-containing protein [Amycolatopsis decaplanina]EME62106.1 GGDEF domain-containing diguanylate cyclase [Amycolatopsis decaplanina DSM 44594]
MVGDSLMATGSGARSGRFAAPCRMLGAWSLWELPRRGLIGYLLLVEAAAFAATVYLFALRPPAWSSLLPFSALLAGMILSSELSRPVERSRADTRLGAGLDAAWIFAGALLLPPGLAAVLVVASAVYRWFRIRRGIPHRQVFAAAATMLSALGASLVPVLLGAPFADATRDFQSFALAFATGLVFLSVDAALAAPAAEFGAEPSGFAFDAAMVAFGLLLAWSAADWPFVTVVLAGAVVVLHRAGTMRALRGHAGTDSGTGLLTASSWLDGARTQFDLLRGRGMDLSLLMLDLDHFARLNDQCGRHVGDDVLRAVADSLRAEVRAADLVGRYGGEEFVVLLPGTSRFDAHAIAERIRLRIASTSVSLGGTKPDDPLFAGTTVSIGVSSHPADGETLDRLIGAADQALRAAKAAGRNRTVVFEPEEPLA